MENNLNNPSLKKIYTDDPNVPYKTTKCSFLYTKSEIDGVLAKFGIKRSGWNMEQEKNNIYIIFHIKEVIKGVEVEVPIRIDCFLVWNRGVRGRPEEVNWNISMRTMYWFIKSLLEAAYLKQSSNTAAFLPYIVGQDGETNFADRVIPKLTQLNDTLSLPEYGKEESTSKPSLKMVN